MEQILIWTALAVVAIWVSYWVWVFRRHAAKKITRGQSDSVVNRFDDSNGHALSSEMRRDDSGR